MAELIDWREFTAEDDAWGKNVRKELRQFAWYFPEKVMKRSGNYSSSLDWDATILAAYPDRVAIHWDHFDDPALRIRIRKFVRDRCAGDVIHMSHDLTYKYLVRYKRGDPVGSGVWERDYASRTEIKHGYLAFYFENAGDAVQFGLLFSDMVSPIEPRHPKRLDVPEDWIQDHLRNPWGVTGEH
jgi:hypothetical protein